MFRRRNFNIRLGFIVLICTGISYSITYTINDLYSEYTFLVSSLITSFVCGLCLFLLNQLKFAKSEIRELDKDLELLRLKEDDAYYKIKELQKEIKNLKKQKNVAGK